MLTKEEMEFTVQEMIDHSIDYIEECDDLEFCVELLKDLKLVASNSYKHAEDYWKSQASVFSFNLEDVISHLCSPLFEGYKLREQIFRKLLSE